MGVKSFSDSFYQEIMLCTFSMPTWRKWYHMLWRASGTKGLPIRSITYFKPLTEEQGFELSQMVEPDSVGEIEPLNSRLVKIITNEVKIL